MRGLALLGRASWAARRRQTFERALALDPCLFDARFTWHQMRRPRPARLLPADIQTSKLLLLP